MSEDTVSETNKSHARFRRGLRPPSWDDRKPSLAVDEIAIKKKVAQKMHDKNFPVALIAERLNVSIEQAKEWVL